MTDLPEVPLNVPLPIPDTVGRPGPDQAGPPRRRRTQPPHRPPRRQPRRHRPVSPAVLLNRRTRAMRLLLVGVFLVMILRLVQVQEFGNRHYAALSKAQLTQTVTVPPVRGGIYDRDGEVLAETVTRQTVVADPQIINDPTAVAAALSPLLGIPAGTLRAQLTEPSGFVYLAHRVPDAVAAKHHQAGHQRDQSGARVAAGGAGRTPGRAGGGHRRMERRRDLRPRVPVPVDPGREAGHHQRDDVARRRGAADAPTSRRRPRPAPGSNSPWTSRSSTWPSRPWPPRSWPRTPPAGRPWSWT